MSTKQEMGFWSHSKCLTRLLPTLALLFIASAVSSAQDYQYPKDSVDSNKRSSLTVDPSSLGLNLQIPLVGYAGRGGTSLPVGLQYSSKVWRMEYGGHVGLNPHVNGWVYPVFTQGSGWTTSISAPGLEDTSMTMQFTNSGVPDCGLGCGPPIPPQTHTYIIYRIQAHMLDGSTHELRKNDTPVLIDANHPYNPDGTYWAVDGSHLRVEYHTGVNAPPDVLYLPDGSRYIYNSDVINYIDRNGNTLAYSLATRQLTDTLGRVVGSPLPVNPTVGDTPYTLPGIGGSSITYTLRWKQLADARTDSNQPLRYVANATSCDLGYTTYHAPSPILFTYGTSCDGDEFYNQLFNPVLLSEIILPNGKSYKFTYNVFGELDKVVYPTGGYERFQHDTIPGISYIRNVYAQGNRGVVDHWISVDGSGTDENDHHWHYAVSYPNHTPPYKVTATAPDGTYSERYLYSSQNNTPYKLDDVRLGRAYDERSYSVSGQMLRRTLTNWAVTGAAPGGWTGGTRNPRVSKSVDLILDTGGDALARTTTYGYDTTYQFDVGIEQTSTNEYDFAAVDQTTAQNGAITAIPLGTLVRTSEKSYLDGDASYRARHLIGLVTSARVKNAAGTIVAQGSISYDETSYPLLTYGSVTGWTDPATNVRGNATTMGSWLNTTNSYLQTHAQYDQCGSVRNGWDAKGNQSQIEYSSSYAYAYPTLARSAVPDPSGQSGSNAALMSTSVFDFNTGLATSTIDANNVATTFEYSDYLNRPTRTVRAAGNGAQSQSPIGYDDTNRVITGRSDLSAFNDNGLKGETVYDGIGRTIESRAYEGGTNYIAVQTQYDALGRAYKVSNPFRPWKSETPVWTLSAFDSLGRVVSITSPDGAVVTIAYSGNTVTVTDQAGKKRRSVTDGLGRLIRVDEPDANNNLDVNGVPVQSTSYSYDVLDNLITVSQGSQTRTFVYDSLKRLTSATNPESGTITYQYDANGNLTQKTDARGVVSTHTYDALNRNISVTYTNDPASTPTVTRTYDGATNGKGKLWKTETAGASGNRTTIDSFDALGRPLVQRQQFYSNSAWSLSYAVNRTYDLAGDVLTQTYPSGHTVNYTYDSAGRTSSFTGNLGEGVTRTYANDFQYTERGSVQQEKFGTGIPLYHKQRFNQRGQLWDMRLSTVPFATDPANGDRGAIVNYYSNNFIQGGSGADNNGNLLRQENYIPGSSFYQDTFAYDSLNRLKSISERLNGTGSDTFKQAFIFDRWGNRTIDQVNTTGNVPHPEFAVDTTKNQLTAPAGYPGGNLSYDPAGNQRIDTYTTGNPDGDRTFDAENRMIEAQFLGEKEEATWAYYSYNGDGQRVRRNVSGYEIWQVYGFDGELLAEYPQTGPTMAVAQPQKEYGYRNGEMLVTTETFTNLAWNKPATQTDNHAPTTTANKAVNGDVDGVMWNGSASATNYHQNSWWQVDLQSVQTIDNITVWGRTDCCPEMTSNFRVFVSDNPFTSYDFNATIAQPGVSNYPYSGFAGPASINVNRTGRYVRVQLAGTQYLVLAEVQVWSQAAKINWMVTDHLGTPRMVADKTGATAGISRHDYLPFGEEIFAGTGGRTTAQGYTASDGVRQQFTSKERDNETGLDYFGARYYAGTMGRFTTPDPYMPSAELTDPQTWNRYSYVLNNPLKYVDPLGLAYSDLSVAQRRLFSTYAAKHNNDGKLTDEQVYATLDDSQMTTYESITHALENTQLTDDKTGKSLGNALSLVERVDEIVGENIGGKTHLRLYANLTSDAVGTLKRSKEFGDSTVQDIFVPDHKRYGKDGKVITTFSNDFRQGGGLPSIQISYAKGGILGDIDIDYRSGSEGHRKHYNSDVRQIGPDTDSRGRPINNYQRHIQRWPELRQWWEQKTRSNDYYKGKSKT